MEKINYARERRDNYMDPRTEKKVEFSVQVKGLDLEKNKYFTH